MGKFREKFSSRIGLEKNIDTKKGRNRGIRKNRGNSQGNTSLLLYYTQPARVTNNKFTVPHFMDVRGNGADLCQ